MLTYCGLTIAVLIYVVVGAFVFQAIEGPRGQEMKDLAHNESVRVHQKWQSLANELSAFSCMPNFTVYAQEIIDKHLAELQVDIDQYGYRGHAPASENKVNGDWSFASSLLFTVSVVTTIGYGNVSPITSVGRMVLIVYALIGIPLMLMFLANIGDLLATLFRTAYSQGCCYLCNQRRKKELALAEAYKKKHGQLATEQDRKRPKRSRRSRRRRSRSPDDHDDYRDRDRDGDSYYRDKEKDRTFYKVWDCPQEEPPVVYVPVSLTLTLIVSYMMMGAILFAEWNDWSWTTSAYFTFVTLSTFYFDVGFGRFGGQTWR